MNLVWRNEMEIGNPQIDNDHRCIIGLMNTVELALRAHPEEVHASLGQLHEYTVEHFRREEQIQREIGYPGLAAHRASHAELAARVGDIRHHIVMALDESDGEQLARLVERLRAWLIEHIAHDDTQLRPFLTEEVCSIDI